MYKKSMLFVGFLFFSSFCAFADTDGSKVHIRIDGALQNNERFQEEVLQIYILKRLKKAVMMLRTIHDKKLFFSLCCRAEKRSATQCVFNLSIPFTHKEIIDCIQTMERTKNLQSFFDLWAAIEARDIEPTLSFLREIALLILVIYKPIYTACCPLFQIAMQKNFILDAAALLSGNFATMNAIELLKVIDTLTAKIPQLLEKYELINSDLTWKQWFSKYWWLPPVAGAAVFFELILLYQIAIGKKQLPQLKSIQQWWSKEHEEAQGNA